MVFAGIPIGVAYAQEPAITVAITTALGSAPRLFARDTAIGIISAVVAVFDMKFVSTQVTIKITRRRRIGLGSAPRSPTILSAISSPAPVVSNAFASVREPPKRNTTFRRLQCVFLGNNSCHVSQLLNMQMQSKQQATAILKNTIFYRTAIYIKREADGNPPPSAY